MATLSNRTFFRGGKTPASSVVGFESQLNRVVRYNLNLENDEQASHVKIVFAENPRETSIGYGSPIESFTQKLNKEMSFYFAISEDPNAFSDAGYEYIENANGKAIFTQTGGYAVEENMKYKVSCEADLSLYPGVQYYFWVFPGFSNLPGGNYTWGWVYWNDVPIDVTLTGNGGIVWVEAANGTKPALVYVRKDGSNKITAPYTRKNGKWYIGAGK